MVVIIWKYSEIKEIVAIKNKLSQREENKMKRKLVVFTLLAATVIGTLSMPNTSAHASAYTSYIERLAAANTGTETMSPDPTQVVFHTDKETKETIRNMFDPAFYAYSYRM